MTILGDYIWLQYYQPGLDVQTIPKYVFKHDPNIGGLYFPFYQYFLGKWNSLDIPEYDLETDELIYKDRTGNEVRREKLNREEMNVTTYTDLTNHAIPQNDSKAENGTSSLLWTHGSNSCTSGFYIVVWQHMHSGLHPGGKESSLLRSKNPICETIGWRAIL
jgi:hypothetical protein